MVKKLKKKMLRGYPISLTDSLSDIPEYFNLHNLINKKIIIKSLNEISHLTTAQTGIKFLTLTRKVRFVHTNAYFVFRLDGYFLWTDTSAASYIHWASPPTGNDCVYMHDIDGTWKDDRCDARHGFICKTPKCMNRICRAYFKQFTLMMAK